MYSDLQQKLNQYYSLTSEEDIKKFELAAIDDFTFWSRKTWCRFTYIYANNALNRKLGRAGSLTGTRYGTRNLDLIPAKWKPKKRNTNTKTIRYFDTGVLGAIRGADGRYKKGNGLSVVNGLWRSFRTGNIVLLTGIWSPVKDKFVTDFSEFLENPNNAG